MANVSICNDKSVGTAFYLIRSEYLKSSCRSSSPHNLQADLNMSLLRAEVLSNGASVMTCRLGPGTAGRRCGRERGREGARERGRGLDIMAPGDSAPGPGLQRAAREHWCHTGRREGKSKVVNIYRLCDTVNTYTTAQKFGVIQTILSFPWTLTVWFIKWIAK